MQCEYSRGPTDFLNTPSIQYEYYVIVVLYLIKFFGQCEHCGFFRNLRILSEFQRGLFRQRVSQGHPSRVYNQARL